MKQDERALGVLKEYWGFPAFRPMQADIIDAVLNGNDCLTLLPTGGGKSLCYQVPAVVLEGICIVISPLVALMKDQVDRLREQGIKAEALHSGMHHRELDRILDNCIYGNIQLLYISPERLHSTLAAERIKRMNVSFVAVDEAHCISQWGHEFRPAYMEIPVVREWHPNVPIIALTATATETVAKDIVTRLELKDPKRFTGSFKRTNLSMLAYRTENKPALMVDIVQKTGGSGLVYARSRRKTKEVSEILTRAGVQCQAYHAGMPHEERSAIQNRWLSGEVPVICCTTAFGMGIDKGDVRFVVHYDLPPSLEEYYQEAGRAGRDGQESYCVLLYNDSDHTALKSTIARSHPSARDVVRVYKSLASHFYLPKDSGEPLVREFNIRDLCKKFKLDIYITFHCLKILEREGWIALSDSVYHPTRIQFTVGKERLFEYQEKNEALGELTMTLLRNYEGVFLEPVRIRDKAVAKNCFLTEEELQESLNRLQKDGILNYLPKSDNPQITFLRPRVELVNVEIDKEHIISMRNRAIKRLDAVTAFLEEEYCREQVLLRYFGEKPESECGKCDLCRERLSGIDSKKVLSRVSDKGTPIHEIVHSFGHTFNDVVVSLLGMLEDDEMIRIENEIVYRKIKSGR